MLIKGAVADKKFSLQLVHLVLPIFFQTLLVNMLGILDALMVGQLGEIEIAAVNISGRIIFFLQIFLFGVGSAASIFVAQFMGKNDEKSLKRVIALSIAIGGVTSLSFATIIFFNSKEILCLLFTNNESVLKIGSQYLKILAVSLVFHSINTIYIAILRSMGEVKLPLWVNLMSFPLKILLNYILIFNVLPIGGYGVIGAAIATIIIRVIESLFIFSLLVFRRRDLIIQVKDFALISRDFILRFIKVFGVVIIKDLVWGAGIVCYTGIYGKMGVGAVTAMSIQDTVQQIIMVLTYALNYTSLKMIGERIGAKQYDVAFEYAKKFILITIISSAMLSVLLVAGVPTIVATFNISADTITHSSYVLYLFALFLPVISLNSILFSGILRSGSDNLFALIIDTIAVWIIGYLLMYLFGLIIKVGIEGVFLCYAMSEVFKVIMALKRVKSNKWMSNIVEDM